MCYQRNKKIYVSQREDLQTNDKGKRSAKKKEKHKTQKHKSKKHKRINIKAPHP